MSKVIHGISTLLALALLCACVPPGSVDMPVADSANIVEQHSNAPLPLAAQQAARQIQADEIKAHIRELASDTYQGRGPGTEGDARTQQYLVSQLQQLGLQPGAGAGRWRQTFELLALTSEQPRQWLFSVAGNPAASHMFAQGDDYIVGTGVQAELAVLQDAQVVFVGYGIQAAEYDWDDYKGVDVRGKVLLMLNNDPHHSADLFAGETRLYYGRWTYKYEIAAALGAAGAIIVHTDYSAGYPWQVVRTSWTGPQYELPDAGETSLQIKAWLSETASARLLALAGQDLAALVEAAQQRSFRPLALNLTTSIKVPVNKQINSSANVLGLLPGSDPQLADEVVIYTAHHDHLGMLDPHVTDAEGEDAGGKDAGGANAGMEMDDLIYNGAMDNASGVASTLAIAKAFAGLPKPPRRSLLFAFVGAEEQGLLGSKYYAANTTFAAGSITANINLDGGQIAGRSRNVSFIGYGRSTLDQVAERVAAAQGRHIVGDQSPSAGYYYRSDHFSLAQIGVPGLYYRGGNDLLEGGTARGDAVSRQFVTQHYHQPSDEVRANWQYDGLQEDAQFGFYAGYLLAQQADKAAWYAGDEFAAARQAALVALDREEKTDQGR